MGARRTVWVKIRASDAERAEFIRSFDPTSSKELTLNERLGADRWEKDHLSEAMDLKLAAIQAEPQRGPDRNYGPSR